MKSPVALLSLSLLTASSPEPADWLIDVAAESGLNFVHFNGMSGGLYFPEMMGPGGAFLDYDGDGDLDVYLVQGTMLGPGKTLKDALVSPRGPLQGRLFRNDLTVHPDGTRLLRFTDVTAASRIEARGYGMGAATGDFDNDGRTDIYLTNLGANQLLRNNGDGTFTDLTAKSGTGEARWSVSASFFDFDRDGWLDLYVGNYVDFPLAANPKCYAPSSRRDYCGPAAFPPLPDTLYRNRGDGTFEDVSARSRIGRQPGPSLGAVAFDANRDGWPDLYVANDGAPNWLWINQRDGTFTEEALLSGVALNRAGKVEGGMGVAAGDFDGDGDEDLFKTNLTGETNTLYVNDGQGMFEDRTLESGLALGSLPFTSFGTAWSDVDSDGWLDLPIVSGAVRLLESQTQAGDPFPLKQTRQLYRNLGGQRFAEVTENAGATFRLAEVGRGAAFGDVDNDGDADILAFNNNGPVRLLLNQVGQRQPWLGLRLVGRGGRDMLGARVEVLRAGAPTLWRRVHTDGSYASANDPRVLLGLAAGSRITAVRVHWPDGKVETWAPPPLNRYTTLRQGEGR